MLMSMRLMLTPLLLTPFDWIRLNQPMATARGRSGRPVVREGLQVASRRAVIQ